MLRNKCTLFGMVLFVVILTGSVHVIAQEATYDPPEFDSERGYTSLSLARTDEAPTIDGTIEPGEWKGATKINVMTNQKKNPAWTVLYRRWVKWWLMWDEENLYLASQSQRLENEMLRVQFRDQSLGGQTVYDDSVEIHFTPFGRNAGAEGLPWSIQAILNPLGVGYYSKFTWDVAARTTAWVPDWPMGSKIHEDSWDIEIAIPRETLDLAEPNEVGDPWSILLVRNWKQTGWHQSAIPNSVENFHTPRSQPAMYLYDGAYAQVQDVSGLHDGRLHTDLRFGNSSDAPDDVTVDLRVEEVNENKDKDKDKDKEDRWQFQKSEEITVKPDEMQSWQLDRADALEEGKTYRYRLQAHADGWEHPLVDLHFFVKPGPNEKLQRRIANLESYEFRFDANYAPTTHKLVANADFLYAPNPDAMSKLIVEVFEKDGDEPLFKGKSEAIHNDAIRDTFDLPELSPGQYRWEMALVNDSGERVANGSGTFEKKNEAEAFEWWDFEGAQIDRVLWPYEPLDVKGASVGYWGGRIHLNGLNLPRQVLVTANEEWRPEELEGRPSVLSRGVQIRAEKDGKEARVDFQGVPRTTYVKDWEVGLRGLGMIGRDVELASEAMVGQEGLLWVELTLRPGLDASSGTDERRESATLDGLTVDIPLRSRVAELMVARAGPGNKGAVKIGAVPEGEDVVWEGADLGRGVLVKGDMLPVVWLGNPQRGLLFLAENNKGWAHAGESDQQIIRRDGEVVLRLNIIQESVTLTGDRTISFGLLPTPMRKKVSGWRMLNCRFSQNFGNTFEKGRNESPDTAGWNSSVMPASYQKSRGLMFSHTQRIITNLGGKEYAPHTERGSYETRSNVREDKSYFGPEWQYNTWTDAFQDHLLWYMEKWIDEGGMTGIYHDQYYPLPMTNTVTGAAYTLENGRVNRGYNMLKDRAMNMRERALFLENNIKPRIFVHATNSGQMIGYPWVTATLDGESNPIRPASGDDWIDRYPPERMQAHGNPWTFGNTFYWMELIRKGDPAWEKKQTRAYVGWQVLHDVMNPVDGRNVRSEDGVKMRKLLFDWGMNKDEVEYWPYWRNDRFVFVDEEDVLVSMWTLPDRLLLCAVNLDRNRTRQATIRVPLRELGLMPEVRAEYIRAKGLLSEDDVNFDAWEGQVRIKVKPRNFRLISIRTYDN